MSNMPPSQPPPFSQAFSPPNEQKHQDRQRQQQTTTNNDNSLSLSPDTDSLPNYNNTVVAANNRWDSQLLPFLVRINASFIGDDQQGELNLDVDDIVIIEKNWDQYWFKGQCDGLRGKLPKFICETIDDQLKIIPWQTILVERHRLFACVASFQAQDLENDISFERGDILMANKQINEHWCFGKRCYQVRGTPSPEQSTNNYRDVESEKMGTFPLNHCWLLDQEKIVEICQRASNSVTQAIHQSDVETNTATTSGIMFTPTTLSMAQHIQHQPPPPSLTETTTAESATTLTSARSSIVSTAQSVQSTNSGHSAAINYPSNLLQPVLSSPAPSSSTSKKSDKKLEHRSTIIMELVQSERDYLSDLRTTRDLFYSDKTNAELLGIDLDEAFGNIDEVIELGEDLLRSLELHNMSKYDNDKCVGRCFIEIIDRFQRIYGDYCKRHDVTIWNKFADKDTKTKYYLKGKLEELQAITNCYDIPTILIKPVQRLAKYPLLLNELSKATEDSHPDKKDLDEAFRLVTDAASHINELRNRSGINSARYHNNKQRGHTAPSMGMSFSGDNSDTFSQSDSKSKAGWLASKFNFHTVKKKTARLSTRITASLGLVSLTRDEEFERHHETFRLVEKTIKSFLKDLTTFVDHFEHFLISLHQASENVAQFYRDQSNQRELELLKQKSKTCMNEHFHEFKRVVDRQVINVISQLLQKFHSPRQLINKRADKLLDFDTKTKKMESCKDVEKRVALREQQVIAKELYESLNRQLIDELPLFNSYAVDIFKNCILVFLKCRRNLITRYSKQATLLLDTPLLMGLSTSSASISSNVSTNMSDIMDNFHVKYSMRVNELLEQVSLLPVAVFQTSHYVQPVGGSRQSSFSNDNNRNSLKEKNNAASVNSTGAAIRRPPRGFNGSGESSCSNDPSDIVSSTYGPDDIYKLTQNYSAVDVCDLNCKKGDIVGVIQRKHPLGHRNKWFVDNGKIKGLVPQKFLTPVEDKVFSGRRQSSYMVSDSGIGSNTGSSNYSAAQQQQGGAQQNYQRTVEGAWSKPAQPPPPQIRLDRAASRTSAGSPVAGIIVSVSPSASVLSTSLDNINLHSPTNIASTNQSSNLNNNHDSNFNNNNDDNKNNLNREYLPSPIDQLKHSGLNGMPASPSARSSATFESSEAGSSRCASSDQRPVVEYSVSLTNSTPKRTSSAVITSSSHYQHHDTVDNGRPISVASELSAEFDPLLARAPSVASSSGAPVAPERHQTPTSSASSSIKSSNMVMLTSNLQQQQVYVASWAFKANGPNQLNLSYNQKLKLLKDCDERGNKDWSLVQAHNGQTGYVPSSYIKLFET